MSDWESILQLMSPRVRMAPSASTRGITIPMNGEVHRTGEPGRLFRMSWIWLDVRLLSSVMPGMSSGRVPSRSPSPGRTGMPERAKENMAALPASDTKPAGFVPLFALAYSLSTRAPRLMGWSIERDCTSILSSPLSSTNMLTASAPKPRAEKPSRSTLCAVREA